jgi:hypothetical protein
MFAVLHALGMFVADLFKSRSRLEAENLFSPTSACHRFALRRAVQGSGAIVAIPIWQGCITNTSGYDFRKGQGHQLCVPKTSSDDDFGFCR